MILIVRATPSTNGLPASLIHATVTENILLKNWTAMPPLWLQLLLILALVAAAFCFRGFTSKKLIGLMLSIFGLFLFGISFFAFSIFQSLIPLFYPALAGLSALVFLEVLDRRSSAGYSKSERRFIEVQIAEKYAQLEVAQARLIETEGQLKTEIMRKNNLSKQNRN